MANSVAGEIHMVAWLFRSTRHADSSGLIRKSLSLLNFPTAMISVVIPSYNRRDCMIALLADVYRQRGTDFEVIVVDDSSRMTVLRSFVANSHRCVFSSTRPIVVPASAGIEVSLRRVVNGLSASTVT